MVLLSLCLPTAHASRGMEDYWAHFVALDRSYTWPYKDLEEERISYTLTHTLTHTHTDSLKHNLYKTKATTSLEGRGLLPWPQTVCILTVSGCVYCTGASRVAECPVTPMDYRGIIHTVTLTHTHTHTNQHSKTITVCKLFFTFRVRLVKQFGRPKKPAYWCIYQ